ncbi:UDP-N-acetylmuramoyl-L-alanyl-D-glutamate--2,6-diaminopimelate ligase [Campylobacter sp. faydin G-105]|uniref:UDP-N-acetylmuramoyl-L-alanyl-D-glutamate--2, 6-diaminopimelate ligase n=1 Tax=Campylobacter anatolicus TaxID=2829105 RepID=UPI001B8FDF9F|nr:UDP-N-acetylmuramoyl-L-alanyl-D-glutamate--2,6-diaminopimelate ligase [Campylobacter anatolicus]MBR8461589.1 UDP-N-acetylmuramoyl-L-alanyl-D-glutamate--2,6-diaminopimelate ligase [Campylobacter anatolicus]
MKIYIENGFVTDNSNECENGCLFIKMSANSAFWEVARERGARLISIDECKKILNIDENIKIVGITGTNGKTTTAAAICSALLNLGFGCGLSGTRGAFINGKRIDEKALTTSPILQTLGYLKVASEQKCKFFIMEVSSHAIAQNRIEGLKFALKIFTNLTQDHLDYHKSMDEYARVKSSFFSDEGLKLINIDDNGGLKFNAKNAYTYSLSKYATFTPIAYGLKGGIDAVVKTPNGDVELSSSLQGEFNLYNLIATIAAIKLLTNASNSDISVAISEFSGVAGRVEVVSGEPLVIVDFAHTPDGIEKVLNALRHLNLVVVFGAGGDRDNTKRPKMGAIAQRYANFCIVTSDNPRSEEPETIIDEICAGMDINKSVVREVDRKKAIELGLSKVRELGAGAALVILGKGDEEYQEIKGVKYPFSDKNIVEACLFPDISFNF